MRLSPQSGMWCWLMTRFVVGSDFLWETGSAVTVVPMMVCYMFDNYKFHEDCWKAHYFWHGCICCTLSKSEIVTISLCVQLWFDWIWVMIEIDPIARWIHTTNVIDLREACFEFWVVHAHHVWIENFTNIWISIYGISISDVDRVSLRPETAEDSVYL